MPSPVIQPPSFPDVDAKLFAIAKGRDLKYFCERIAALKAHAVLHDGEPCAKICRARIGGMLEVLNRIGLEVDTDWDSVEPDIGIFTVPDFLKRKGRAK
jgi:hypothetical protein